MRHNKHIFITILLLYFCSEKNIFAQDSNKQRDNVIAQMNYCVNSLTNLVHNKSITSLQHESDQLINNLTMEQLVGLNDIKDFRIDLMNAVSRFQITEEEKALIKRIQSIKRQNLIWSSVSNALEPTMIIMGKGKEIQTAFLSLLTVARSAVEYKSNKNEQSFEELNAMWELRKEDLKIIHELRRSAQSIVFNLYNKYNLSESDRLTEATANLLNDYISDPNVERRVRLLKDHYNDYKQFTPYYYYLGMAYIDLGKYELAKPYLDIYLERYSKAPILRYDEMSGCIALSKLTFEQNLSKTEKINLINQALTNLPNNSAAALQCAMIYLNSMNEPKKALDIIRAGLDDPHATNKELLFLSVVKLWKTILKYPSIKKSIKYSINNTKSISLNTYLLYLTKSNENTWWQIMDLFSFNDISYRPLSKLKIMGDREINPEFHIHFSKKYNINLKGWKFYIENHEQKKIIIQELQYNFRNSVSLEDIEDVSCFNENKNLKYLFMDVITPSKLYLIKSGLDYRKIKSEDFPRMSEFILSSDDIDDIINFCKDNLPNDDYTELEFSELDGNKKEIDKKDYILEFKGTNLVYTPHYSNEQKGSFLRIVTPNNLNLVYFLDSDKDKLQPYYYKQGQKISFANDKIMKMYTSQDKPTEKSTLDKTVDLVKEKSKETVNRIKSIWD